MQLGVAVFVHVADFDMRVDDVDVAFLVARCSDLRGGFDGVCIFLHRFLNADR